MKRVFPPWTNHLRPLTAIGAGGALFYAVLVVTFGFSPEATDVGYRPEQPVPFSHAMHAGQLGMDCRYCHSTVERARHAAIPPTQTCMGCHERVREDSRRLTAVRESWASNEPVRWVRVHDLPDYVYFDHSAHVLKGVGCVSCHGRIDQMEVVEQKKPLSMGWCLSCHRDPTPNLRPRNMITRMDWEPSLTATADTIAAIPNVKPSQDCSTCHR